MYWLSLYKKTFLRFKIVRQERTFDPPWRPGHFLQLHIVKKTSNVKVLLQNISETFKIWRLTASNKASKKFYLTVEVQGFVKKGFSLGKINKTILRTQTTRFYLMLIVCTPKM